MKCCSTVRMTKNRQRVKIPDMDNFNEKGHVHK